MTRHQLQLLFMAIGAIIGFIGCFIHNRIAYKRSRREVNKWLEQAKREHRL